MDATRVSADIAMLAYAIAWAARVEGLRFWRLGWYAYAASVLLVIHHIVIAFRWSHGGSLAAALAHTAQETEAVVGLPIAWGLYFNFVFVAVLAADVAWLHHVGDWQQRRPRWLAKLVDLFLVGIVLMSTIVFEDGWVRWLAAAITIGLVIRARGKGAGADRFA